MARVIKDEVFTEGLSSIDVNDFNLLKRQSQGLRG